MANPYLKRGSGSHNKTSGSKNEERESFFKKFWTKHKAIIIGASVAVISIPIGVTVWRKMQDKKQLGLGSDNTQNLLTDSSTIVNDEQIMDVMLQQKEKSRIQKEPFPVATQELDFSKIEQIDVPENPRANITFSASDFE